MKNLKKYLILFLGLIPLVASSQYFSKSIDVDFGSDTGVQIEVNENGEMFILSGSFCNNSTTPCIGLVKLNEEGEVIWKISIDESLQLKMPGALLLDEDRIFILAYSVIQDSNRVVVLELNQFGDLINHRNFGENLEKVVPNVIKKYKDGYLLNLRYGNLGMERHGRIEIYDQNFIFLQAIEYGEVYGNFDWGATNIGEDGNILVANLYREYNDEGEKVYKALFTKINEMGEKEWEKAMLYGSYPVVVPNIIDLKNNTYAAAWRKEWTGLPWEFAWLNVIYGMTTTGEITWEQNFSTITDSDDMAIAHLFTTQNGDIIGLGGDAANYEGFPELEEGGWLFRLNNQGDILWQRNITDLRMPALGATFTWGQELDNGDLVFIGTIIDTLDNGIFNYDVWVVKTDANGCLVPDCTSTQFITHNGIISNTFDAEDLEGSGVKIFPNPALNELTIERREMKQLLQIQIYDILGNEVLKKQITFHQKNIDISSLPQGCYFIQIENHLPLKFIKL